ncbi:MAG: hypothetical protein WC663_00810 [Patescibacteria group bacterium]|jgi:hypothetical protein
MEAKNKFYRLIGIIIIFLSIGAIAYLSFSNYFGKTKINNFGEDYPVDEIKDANEEKLEELVVSAQKTLDQQIKNQAPDTSKSDQEMIREQIINKIYSENVNAEVLAQEKNIAQSISNQSIAQLNSEIASGGNDNNQNLNSKILDLADKLFIKQKAKKTAQETVNEINDEVTSAINNSNLDSRKQSSSAVNIMHAIIFDDPNLAFSNASNSKEKRALQDIYKNALNDSNNKIDNNLLTLNNQNNKDEFNYQFKESLKQVVTVVKQDTKVRMSSALSDNAKKTIADQVVADSNPNNSADQIIDCANNANIEQCLTKGNQKPIAEQVKQVEQVTQTINNTYDNLDNENGKIMNQEDKQEIIDTTIKKTKEEIKNQPLVEYICTCKAPENVCQSTGKNYTDKDQCANEQGGECFESLDACYGYCKQPATVEEETVATCTKLIICHIPSDNPENQQEICVAESAAKAHYAHGDYEGYCKTAPTNEPVNENTNTSNETNENINTNTNEIANENANQPLNENTNINESTNQVANENTNININTNQNVNVNENTNVVTNANQNTNQSTGGGIDVPNVPPTDNPDPNQKPPLDIQPVENGNFFAYCDREVGQCRTAENMFKDENSCLSSLQSQFPNKNITACIPFDSTTQSYPCLESCTKTTPENQQINDLEKSLHDYVVENPVFLKEEINKIKEDITEKTIRVFNEKVKPTPIDQQKQDQIVNDLKNEINQQIQALPENARPSYEEVIDKLAHNESDEISLKAWIVYKGLGRVILKFEENEFDVYKKLYSENVIKSAFDAGNLKFKFGEKADDLKYDFKIYKDQKSDRFYAVVYNLGEDNLVNKDNDQYGSKEYYFQVATDEKFSEIFTFKSLNRVGEALYDQNKLFGQNHDLKRYGTIAYDFNKGSQENNYIKKSGLSSYIDSNASPYGLKTAMAKSPNFINALKKINNIDSIKKVYTGYVDLLIPQDIYYQYSEPTVKYWANTIAKKDLNFNSVVQNLFFTTKEQDLNLIDFWNKPQYATIEDSYLKTLRRGIISNDEINQFLNQAEYSSKALIREKLRSQEEYSLIKKQIIKQKDSSILAFIFSAVLGREITPRENSHYLAQYQKLEKEKGMNKEKAADRIESELINSSEYKKELQQTIK